MAGFSLSNKAMADLKEIGRYTQKHWGQRDLYLGLLDTSFRQLASNPLRGKDCGDILKGYRKFNAGSHVIFYHLKSLEMIGIVRILHVRMDIVTRLSES